MNEKKHHTLCSQDYDLAGFQIGRLIKSWLLWKSAPYGMMEHGPSYKELFMLFLHHKIGMQWIKLKARLKR